MKTAYVVTDGDYSDYRILGVFSTRPLADAFVKEYGITASVEEWPVDKLAGATNRDVYAVEMYLPEGEIVREWTHKECVPERYTEIQTRPETRSYSRYFPPRVTARSAKSPQHARKLAVESRQAWLRTQTEPVAGDAD